VRSRNDKINNYEHLYADITAQCDFYEHFVEKMSDMLTASSRIL